MTYVAIRVLSALGLAHSVKLPKLTPPAFLLPTGASRPTTAPSVTSHRTVVGRRVASRRPRPDPAHP